MTQFDPQNAKRSEIIKKADWLIGKTFRQVRERCLWPVSLDVEKKGAAGHLIEAYFGIRPNSKSEADFTSAGIELKTVPVKRVGAKDGKVLERTSVTMVDFMSLPKEDWSRATVRKKLAGILFVFCERDRTRPIESWRVLGITEWSPDSEVEPQLRADWEYGRDLVRLGRAHFITESAGKILGMATKGPGGTRTVPQPFSEVEVRPRAWALKANYTRAMLLKLLDPKEAFADLVESAGTSLEDFEPNVLEFLGRFTGKSLSQISKEVSRPVPSGKGGNAFFIRQLLGAKKQRGRIRQFEELGIEIKTLRVGPNLKIYEAISFPAFDYWELLEETWEDSDLRHRIQRVLFIPLMAPKNTTDPKLLKLGRGFFWTPNEKQLEGIMDEWRSVKKLVEARRGELTGGASNSSYIHTRPHGKDSTDRVDAPGGIPLGRQSFWLNPDFIRSIMSEYGVGESWPK